MHTVSRSAPRLLEKSKPTSLVVVAYPLDEVLFFSSLSEEADVLVVGDRHQCGCPQAVVSHFANGTGFDKQKICYLHLACNNNLSLAPLEDALRSLGTYDRVYTHSPLDADTFRLRVTFIVSRMVGSVLVPALGSSSLETHSLSREAFAHKLKRINEHYSAGSCRASSWCSLSLAEITGVEAFTNVTYDDVIRAIAVTTRSIISQLDIWGFTTSPYEARRLSTTCSVLQSGVQREEVKTILELGACEGEMTQQLRAIFPSATIRAVERHAVFAKRLMTRFCNDDKVEVINASLDDVALASDLVIFTEVLCYLEESLIKHTLDRICAKHLLISNGRTNGDMIWDYLKVCKWNQLVARNILPTFEPVDGNKSSLVSLRTGTTIRLWRHSGYCSYSSRSRKTQVGSNASAPRHVSPKVQRDVNAVRTLSSAGTG